MKENDMHMDYKQKTNQKIRKTATTKRRGLNS